MPTKRKRAKLNFVLINYLVVIVTIIVLVCDSIINSMQTHLPAISGVKGSEARKVATQDETFLESLTLSGKKNTQYARTNLCSSCSFNSNIGKNLDIMGSTISNTVSKDFAADLQLYPSDENYLGVRYKALLLEDYLPNTGWVLLFGGNGYTYNGEYEGHFTNLMIKAGWADSWRHLTCASGFPAPEKSFKAFTIYMGLDDYEDRSTQDNDIAAFSHNPEILPLRFTNIDSTSPEAADSIAAEYRIDKGGFLEGREIEVSLVRAELTKLPKDGNYFVDPDNGCKPNSQADILYRRWIATLSVSSLGINASVSFYINASQGEYILGQNTLNFMWENPDRPSVETDRYKVIIFDPEVLTETGEWKKALVFLADYRTPPEHLPLDKEGHLLAGYRKVNYKGKPAIEASFGYGYTDYVKDGNLTWYEKSLDTKGIIDLSTLWGSDNCSIIIIAKSDALVYVNGEYKGKTNSTGALVIPSLFPGYHELKITAGGTVESALIYLSPGENKIVTPEVLRASPLYATKCLYDFKLHNATVFVTDEAGNPIKGALIKAFSLDWGVMYPHFEEWGVTDKEGKYNFMLPTGNWVFIASSGWDYAAQNPNKGLFLQTTAYIDSDVFITLKPSKSTSVEVIDERGAPLPMDEIYVLVSKYVPAVSPAFVGRTTTGVLTLLTNIEDQNLTVIAIKRTSTNSDGYILVKEVKPEDQMVNIISSMNSSKLLVTAYETDGSLSNYWDIEFRLPDLYLGNWVFLFPITGRSLFHITPMNVVVNARYIPPGWYYYFESIALTLQANSEYSYSFGGKGSFRMWIVKQDTQLWFDIRDEFGNVLAFYSDPTGGRNITLRVFEGDSEVYRDNIGNYIPGTLFYGVGRTFTDSARFELYADLGPLGGLGKVSMSGLLYDESRLVKYRDMQSEDFALHIPTEYFWNVSRQVRVQTFIDTLEAVYKSMGACLGERLQGKPHRVEVNLEWCGIAGTNFIGFGVGVARWPVHVHHGWLGVLSHELGHMYSFTPPLVYHVECPLFCEPLATYLGIEAVANLYGTNVRLWYWGTHPAFFDYISGDKNVSEIERMQFVFFYLHKVYGADIHRQFFQLWANNTSMKDRLMANGFNVNETMITLYSYLARQNLAWLFQMAGYGVSDERINDGLKLILNNNVNVIAVVRGMDNSIYYKPCLSGCGYVKLSGATPDSPSAVLVGGRLYVAVRGMDGGSIYFGRVESVGSSSVVWQKLPGSTPSRPALASDGSKVYVVVRGGDNGIYVNVYDLYSASWSGWKRLSGSTAKGPAAAVLGGKLHLVVVGSDGRSIYYGQVDPAQLIGSSSYIDVSWSVVDGFTDAEPSLATDCSKLYLAVKGLDSRVYVNIWEGSWSGWERVPTGSTPSSPAATVWFADGCLYITVRGNDNGIYYTRRTSFNSYTPWSALDGTTPSAPSTTQ
jgi:hypothetical protein